MNEKKYIASFEKTFQSLNKTQEAISSTIENSTKGLDEIRKVVSEYNSWLCQFVNFWGSSEQLQRIKEALNQTQEIFKNLDISQYVIESSKNFIRNGIYTYSKFAVFKIEEYDNEFTDECKQQIFEIINEDKDDFKNEIIEEFSKYKDVIEEIYDLYDEEKYRLCVLSLINLISNIYNDYFDKRDFTDKRTRKYIEDKYVTEENKKYLELMPIYHFDINNLCISFQGEPDKYQNYSYNRNGIIHGYIKNFGTRENCLRYFSALINAKDLVKEFFK